MSEGPKRGSIAHIVPGLVLPLARDLDGPKLGRYADETNATQQERDERLQNDVERQRGESSRRRLAHTPLGVRETQVVAVLRGRVGRVAQADQAHCQH